MNKKWLSTVATALMAGIMLTGCGAAGDNDAPPAGDNNLQDVNYRNGLNDNMNQPRNVNNNNRMLGNDRANDMFENIDFDDNGNDSMVDDNGMHYYERKGYGNDLNNTRYGDRMGNNGLDTNFNGRTGGDYGRDMDLNDRYDRNDGTNVNFDRDLNDMDRYDRDPLGGNDEGNGFAR
ncbi:hypothetical protein EJF36_19525 [Bacillus sp. HMF5848]|uniref:hypothetical protein n=1 Tax=Bacillus sp. HMF5848 TaxID=2495421 RepID=UPI000F7AAB17|nr:hypothetical protein [Bacillus sp. HMF5848]RSK28890.1 hypothetical protein EJF36_19525 [Bacillus sp. HMF5848]